MNQKIKRRFVRENQEPAKVYAYVDPSTLSNELVAVPIIRQMEDNRKKHGTQDLTLFDWVAILGEEFGEVCRAVIEHEMTGNGTWEDIMGELVDMMAVAQTMIEIIHEEYEPVE